jgi:hypothetical protein
MGTMFRAKCHIHAEINAYRYRKTCDWKAIRGSETSVYVYKELYVMIKPYDLVFLEFNSLPTRLIERRTTATLYTL